MQYSFKEHLPEDGQNRWPKHMWGYADHNIINLHICGNKMPAGCNRRNFYCRSYCLLNMFRAPLCPSSGVLEYYTSGCCLSYLVLCFQFDGTVWSWGLCVRFAGCCPQTGHIYISVYALLGRFSQEECNYLLLIPKCSLLYEGTCYCLLLLFVRSY
jgi:hypothetical protein